MTNIGGANIMGENVFSAVGSNGVGSNGVGSNAVGSNASKNTEKKQKCSCYSSDSTDARCCGLCYCCCPAKHIDKEMDLNRCDFCPNDFCEYWYSGYVQTHSGYGHPEEEINGICCWFCFPLKFPIFFPCFLGSLVNHAINQCCAAPQKRNYLC